MSTQSVAGVLLAAGVSQRMGETNKLLLPVGRRTLLKRSLDVLGASCLESVVVVLGHELSQSAPIVSAAGVPWIINPHFQDGQQSSLRAGLQALGNSYDSYLVMLADLPTLQPDTLDVLVDAVNTQPNADAWVPHIDGQRGNPRVISQNWCRQLLEDGDLPSRALFKRHPDRVVDVPVTDAGVLNDIDTPDDYSRYLSVQHEGKNGFH